MNKFLWYLAKWIVGTPILILGGLAVILFGTILTLWGIMVIVSAPFISPFAEIKLDKDDEVYES